MIIFSKDIDTVGLITAHNNNIIRFTSDSPLIITTAIIRGLIPTDIILYPDPTGSFYFNYKDYLKVAIIENNLNDDLSDGLDNSNPQTFIYNVTNSCFKKIETRIIVNFANNTSEGVHRVINVLNGVEQYDDRITRNLKPEILNLLSPSKVIKYWKGYPFEFSFLVGLYLPDDVDITITGESAIDAELTSAGRVNSLFLSDGLNEFPTGLSGGLTFSVDNDIKSINVCEFKCGVYIKFLNKYGRWNYWLFDRIFYKTKTTKYLQEIDNDFNNVNDTISPTLQVGKISDTTIKCAAKGLDQNDKLVLDGIINSPKIFLFTGETNNVNKNNTWIEVRLKTNSLQIFSSKKMLYTYVLELDLPADNTITL
ncbi:hypothetical protein OX284_014560 [Flavobacterium sp. SUN046]|uniref:hypothetical protein n=1 Tax=Flavobacterium sp. SUN046 TaxID=3002440 RepID=UPI002DB59D77|nr:hypothetical protein [Flavobacterium sp. SUN046]MEC4050658.1 hypothetical protein [Flavobacterium sp. SUN046]